MITTLRSNKVSVEEYAKVYDSIEISSEVKLPSMVVVVGQHQTIGPVILISTSEQNVVISQDIQALLK